MFCDQCGARLPAGAKFCPVCGHKLLDTETASSASAEPPPAPELVSASEPTQPQPQPIADEPATRPPSPVSPNTSQAAVETPNAEESVEEEASIECVILYAKSLFGKPPGKRNWHYDVLITDKRVILIKVGKLGVLAKGIAAGRCMEVDLGIGEIVSRSASKALSMALLHARMPDVSNERVAPSEAIDALTVKKESYEVTFADATDILLRSGGLFGDAKLVVTSPAGPFTAGIDTHFKRLKEVLPEALQQPVRIGK